MQNSYEFKMEAGVSRDSFSRKLIHEFFRKICGWPVQNYVWLLIALVLAITTVFPALRNGFGISGEKSTTQTTQKDGRGNIVGTTETVTISPGKTLWDSLSLSGVPILLAILGYLFSQQQQKRDIQISKEQDKIAAKEAREETLQAYFDRLSALLIDNSVSHISTQLKSKKATPKERELLDSTLNLVREKTLSALKKLGNDGERKDRVIRFLVDSKVFENGKFNLKGADLSYAKLANIMLENVDLTGVNFTDADLRFANLCEAKLVNAKFLNTNLLGANIIHSDLENAKIMNANLGSATLYRSNLCLADLSGADLTLGYLKNASLIHTELDGADVRGAVFGKNLGLSEQGKDDLKERGAIFEDSPASEATESVD